MLESGIGESHPWEVMWQVKGFYGAEYLGTIGSTLTITNHNDEVSSKKLIDVNATKDSCPKPKKPGPKSLHDPAAEDASLRAVKIDLQGASEAGETYRHNNMEIIMIFLLDLRIDCELLILIHLFFVRMVLG
jgi:hypothetical protein